MDFYRDQHVGTKDTQYYLAMSNIEHFSLNSQARTLAERYIEDAWLRMKFITDTEHFSARCVEQIRVARDNETCKFVLNNMRHEKENLRKQEIMLLAGEAKLYVSATFQEHKEGLGYIIDGIGMVIGGLQVIGGIGIAFSSLATGNVIGVIVGATICINGVNSLQESLQKIQGVKNPVGMARGAYMDAAEFLGFDRQVGDFTFQAVDLSTSIYGVSRFVINRDTWRLFYYIPQDFQRKINTMSKSALALKVIGVGNKLRVMEKTATNDDDNYKR